jgi:hypothetical protein
MTKASVLAASAVAALVAGCAGIPIIYNTYYDSTYQPGEQTYGGPLGVAVLAPSAGPELTRSVIEAMQGPIFGIDAHLEAWTPQLRSAYRVVVLFDPLNSTSSAALCAGMPAPDPAAPVAPARIPVTAALCRADKVMSAANASVPFGAGPASPGFRTGMEQIALVLFPARNPHLDMPPE